MGGGGVIELYVMPLHTKPLPFCERTVEMMAFVVCVRSMERIMYKFALQSYGLFVSY